jgi:zinc protease
MSQTRPVRFSVPNSNNIHRQVLPNGIKVLAFCNPHVQSVYLLGTLKAGSIYESGYPIGVASLTASMLMRGTLTRDFDTLHSALEDVGADLGIGAGVHHVSFSGKALASDLGLLLELLADALRHPSFPEEHLNLMRTQRLTELQYAQQDTRYRAGRAFREMLYPQTHPYHQSNYGSVESLPQISTDMLREFHQKHYGVRDMVIVVVGNIEPSTVAEQINQVLGDWQSPQQPSAPAIAMISPPTQRQIHYTSIEGKTQSDIVLGTLAPSRLSSDYMTASLANSILGEFGMMGRIGGVIREELGLAYYASSSVEGAELQGAWSISAGVAHQNVQLTIEKALEQVQRISQEPVSLQDLQDNQSYYVGRLPIRLESNSGIANSLEMMERLGLGLDYLANYHEMIYSITIEDILRVTQTYLNPSQFVISIAGVQES